MSDSKLHLMSFAPVPDTKTTVHVVGLPDSLRDALFTLMPPRKEGGYLNTKVLKDDLRCWLDRAVELNPVRPNVHTDSWLIALAPIDLAKLCNVIAVWISSRKDIDTQSPAYRKVMGMLHPETFEEAVRGEEICLFSGDGRPTGRLTFPAFSAQVADAIADIPLELANGMVENFSRVSRGNGNVYELISDIHWHKEDPWAFALRFHVETLPVGRKARLNMDVAVRASSASHGRTTRSSNTMSTPTSARKAARSASSPTATTNRSATWPGTPRPWRTTSSPAGPDCPQSASILRTWAGTPATARSRRSYPPTR